MIFQFSDGEFRLSMKLLGVTIQMKPIEHCLYGVVCFCHNNCKNKFETSCGFQNQILGNPVIWESIKQRQKLTSPRAH